MEQPPVRTPDGRIWVRPDSGEVRPRHADEPVTCDPIALQPVGPDDPRYIGLAEIAVDDDAWELEKIRGRSHPSARLARFQSRAGGTTHHRHSA